MKRFRPSCELLEERQLLSGALGDPPPQGNSIDLQDLAAIPAFRSDRPSMQDLRQTYRDAVRGIVKIGRLLVDSSEIGELHRKIQRDQVRIIQAMAGTGNEARVQRILNDPTGSSLATPSPALEAQEQADLASLDVPMGIALPESHLLAQGQANLASLGVPTALTNELCADTRSVVGAIAGMSQDIRAQILTDLNKLRADGARTGAVQPGSPIDRQLRILATADIGVASQP